LNRRSGGQPERHENSFQRFPQLKRTMAQTAMISDINRQPGGEIITEAIKRESYIIEKV
jgi:hypothetical protein